LSSTKLPHSGIGPEFVPETQKVSGMKGNAMEYGTKAFKELTYEEQALWINGAIAHLKKAIRFHARFGAVHTQRSELEILEKNIRQIERLARRLRGRTLIGA
jgi:hypothetical protein